MRNHMKKTPLTLLALLACMLFFGALITYLPASSAVIEEASPSTEKFINEEKGYSFEYPKDWTKQDIPRLDIVLVSPAKDENQNNRATMNLVSESVGNTITLDHFYNESVKHLTSELQDAKIENSGDIQLNNIPSKWVQYSHKMLDSDFKVLQYFLIIDGNLYLMTFSSAASEFDHFRPAFESIANSFKQLPKSKEASK